MTRHLEVDDLLHVVERLTGKPAVLADAGQLAAAVARPRAQVRGVEAYPSLGEQAAALLLSLASSRGLVDGNTRLAWVATRVFCAANGAPLTAPDDAVVELVRGLAFGDQDVASLAVRLGEWMTPRVVPDA